MLLREFIYFDEDQAEMPEKLRYDPTRDTSVIKLSDLRKARLTLGRLSELRKAGDAREQEHKEEMSLVRKMYSTPPPQQ